MLELAVRLELKRQAMRGKAISGLPVRQSVFGLAALIFFVCTPPQIIVPPVALATAPPEFIAVGALILIGCLLIATVAAAPLGFIFF